MISVVENVQETEELIKIITSCANTLSDITVLRYSAK